MMILVDQKGHMVATGGVEELHAFALRLGLRREWFQTSGKYPHYDLTSRGKWHTAIRAGATLVSSRYIVKIMRLVKGDAMRHVTARFYFDALEATNDCSTYKEMPHLAENLIKALGIDLEVPKRFQWGTWEAFQAKIARKIIKQYPSEELVRRFPEWVHVLILSDEVRIVGRKLLDKLSLSIPADTGFKELTIIGYKYIGS